MIEDVTTIQHTLSNGTRYERTIKRIKAADRPPKTADDYVRDHEIALVKLLVPKYRDIVRDLVK